MPIAETDLLENDEDYCWDLDDYEEVGLHSFVVLPTVLTEVEQLKYSILNPTQKMNFLYQ